jgi:hypothetical protein
MSVPTPNVIVFREKRDGRHVVALNFYPRLRTRTLKFLRCTDSLESVQNAILQWRADEREVAAAEQGLVLAMVRTNDEFRKGLQYMEVLMPCLRCSPSRLGDRRVLWEMFSDEHRRSRPADMADLPHVQPEIRPKSPVSRVQSAPES